MKCCALSMCFFATVALWSGCRNVFIIPDGEGPDSGISEMDSCAPPGLTPLVCHNFEAGITAPSVIIDGQILWEAERVHTGQGAMKSETFAINSYAYIIDRFDAIESGTIFFRMFLYIPPGNTIGTTKVVNLSAGGNPEDEQGVDIDVSSQRSIDIYQHGNATRFVSPPGMVPEGEWFCLSGSYTISNTAGQTSVWINESLAVSTTASPDSIINGGISEFRTGIGWTESGQTTSAVFYDDVLVDTVPVTCFD